ncbi:allatostatin-A receptor-like isoform X2 [Mizuhopecten yessoensis]|uniref:Allatostatin-A receptor n=1 Tax=Mizuhopecten yessoensis TaxID=6573 RepID=A0A210PUD4_MIZYE|nr:allatostatin-A receptor-like isoform X2 [Mizuhopecten yessoensis]OWF40117.1 Allatostatin-A receptor [Mizuhopecten yessoensis]
MNESGSTAIPDNSSTAFPNDTFYDYEYWSSEEENFLYLIKIVVSIVFSLIVLIGFVGNLLVIIVVFSNKKMQNTTNILIVSLAVADLSFIIFCVPFTATTYTMSRWPFGDVWCKIVQYLTYVCAYASVYTLVLMSLDRYLAVVHPITSMRIRTSRNTYIMVYLTWIIMLGGNIPVIFEFSHKEFGDNSNRSSCVDIDFFKADYLSSQPFYGCFFAFGYVIPLTLTSILYGFMIKRLLYGVVPGGSQRPDSMRSKKRVTRMVVIVVVIFAICWLPIQIIFVLISFGHVGMDSKFFVGTLIASNCLAYMNSCVNPVLYAFLSENFRRSFRRLLCCASDPLRSGNYHGVQSTGVERTEMTSEI